MYMYKFKIYEGKICVVFLNLFLNYMLNVNFSGCWIW